jgi:O-antigen ligase
MLPAALVLLAGFALACIGERYVWPILPSLVGAAGLFLVSGTRIGADPETRSLDVVMIAVLAVIGVQMLPLPPALVRGLSPSTPGLQDVYAFQPYAAWRPLSIHPAATRVSFALALAAALTFWTARETFSRGGTRRATRLLAWMGLACAAISLAQRATAPTTVLWKWSVPDPRALPFGLFVDRNQLAMWLTLAICLVFAYLTMHVHARFTDRTRRDLHAVIVALSDGGALVICGCAAIMVLTLAATLSRSGFVGLVTAALAGAALACGNRRHVLSVGVVAAIVLGAAAAWLNFEGLTQRIVTTASGSEFDATGRVAIWGETFRIVRDFPVLGTGAGTFADAMFVYQQTAREVLFNNAHDEYLQLQAEGGGALLLASLAGCGLVARVARARVSADRGAHRYLRIGACAGLAGIAVQSIWEAGLRAPANLILAAIVAAIAVRPVVRGNTSVTLDTMLV